MIVTPELHIVWLCQQLMEKEEKICRCEDAAGGHFLSSLEQAEKLLLPFIKGIMAGKV